MGEKQEPVYTVKFGQIILSRIPAFPYSDIHKIKTFAQHVVINGFDGLPGRNKRSDDIDRDDPYYRDKVVYVDKHNLHHYHIGIPEYKDGDFGDKTSEYILHYTLNGNEVAIVHFDWHPPFKLPEEEMLVVAE